jgi:hypothetical protein
MSPKLFAFPAFALALLYQGSAVAGNVSALWHFDEKAGLVSLDSSGNGNTGVLMDATFDSHERKYGASSLRLIGDGYVLVNDSVSLRPVNLTVEAWVKTTSDGFVVANSGPGLNIGYELALTEGKVHFIVGNGPVHGGKVGGTPVADGRWHHIAGTYDGAFIRVYVDGAMDGSLAYTGGVGYAGDALYIGRRQFTPSPGYFSGSIDEVRIWSRALYAYEILNSAQTGLRALWHFDEAAGSTLEDSSGYGNYGSLSGDVTAGIPGKYGRAGHFNGGQMLVTHDPMLNFKTGSFTVELWVKADALGVTEQTVLRKQESDAVDPRDLAGWHLSMDPSHGNRWKVLLRGPGGYQPVLWSTAPATTGWTHLSFTVDKGPTSPGNSPSNNLSFYVDGVLQGEIGSPGGGVSPPSATPPLSIGSDSSGASPFHGAVDEVHIWGRALRHGEIEVLAGVDGLEPGGGPLALPEEMGHELGMGGAVFTSSWQVGMSNPVTCLLYFIPAVAGTEFSDEDPRFKATPNGTSVLLMNADDSENGQAILFTVRRVDAKTLHVLIGMEDGTRIGFNVQWAPVKRK